MTEPTDPKYNKLKVNPDPEPAIRCCETCRHCYCDPDTQQFHCDNPKVVEAWLKYLGFHALSKPPPTRRMFHCRLWKLFEQPPWPIPEDTPK